MYTSQKQEKVGERLYMLLYFRIKDLEIALRKMCTSQLKSFVLFVVVVLKLRLKLKKQLFATAHEL